ncbi:MAG: molybdate ABC transporter substrate-binding protein [Nitrospinota bacterium]
MRRAFFVLFLSLLTLASAPRGEAAQAARLTVSAAISLRESFQRIAREFQAARPGDRVALNFASSGHLQRQIERGAPVDVFAAAGRQPMDALERAKLVRPGTRRVFATNRLALIRPRGSAAVKSFGSLGRRFAGRLVIGNPAHVPAGFYARQALQSMGYWEALRPSLILAQHVRQVLDYVARGEVDAGIVYLTDVRQARGRVDLVAEAPAGSHAAIEYPIAVMAETRFPRAAEAFVRFVLGPKGRSALAEAGFGPVSAPRGGGASPAAP